jgi:(1->4)-alpha-D-glucan 1-alpha-D-glucosylmutase
MRLQQYTAPVTAKALEDTSFYRYHRLVSLNEVGGDPRRFGTSPAAFHKTNADRARRWPHAMLSTSTHDAKRGEDTRLRIHALSEMAAEWDARVQRWSTWNHRFQGDVDDQPAPAPDDEYLLYQTLVGSWPHADGENPAATATWLATYHQRVRDYAIKALREGKRHSSWRHPNAEYEEKLLAFIASVLDPERAGPFLGDLAEFVSGVARVAALHGLAQTLLKLCAPGVPDLYQGTELWDLALADPDNRRPVDFAQRSALLAEAATADPARVAHLFDAWPDGRIKLWLTSQLLPLRRQRPELVRDGEYLPLTVEGAEAERVVAFARRSGDAWLIAIAPRLVAPLLAEGAGLRIAPERWGDTVVRLSLASAPGQWRDVLSGRTIGLASGTPDASLPLASALATLPFAVLLGGDAEGG